MKTRLTAALLTLASIAIAQAPPIIIDIESGQQQAQTLRDLTMVQGASAEVRMRLTSQGRYLSLGGYSGKLAIRPSAVSLEGYDVSGSVVTSTPPHYIRFALTPSQTGSSVTNWGYSLAAVYGDADYMLGRGRWDVEAGTWTGSAAALTNVPLDWAQVPSYVNTATHGPHLFGAGFSWTTNAVGQLLLTSLAGTPAWESITGKPETFPPSPHGYESITNAPWLLSFTELDPVFSAWLLATPPLYEYTETDPVWGASSNAVLTHVASTANPHGVTAAQAGAVATNDGPYLAALTNVTGAGGITVTGTGRTRQIDGSGYATTGTVAAIDARVTGVETGKVDKTDARYLASLTNAAAFATAAQGTAADGALQRSGGIMDANASISNVYRLSFSGSGSVEAGPSSLYIRDHTGAVVVDVLGGFNVETNATVSGRLTVGSFDATRTPYAITYAPTVTVSTANGNWQRIASVTGPIDIQWPVGLTNVATAIMLDVPAVGTNNAAWLTGGGITYYHGDSLTNGPSTNTWTHAFYQSPHGTTNATVSTWKGAP
jgi:hypothetical protein